MSITIETPDCFVGHGEGATVAAAFEACIAFIRSRFLPEYDRGLFDLCGVDVSFSEGSYDAKVFVGRPTDYGNGPDQFEYTVLDAGDAALVVGSGEAKDVAETLASYVEAEWIQGTPEHARFNESAEDREERLDGNAREAADRVLEMSHADLNRAFGWEGGEVEELLETLSVSGDTAATMVELVPHEDDRDEVERRFRRIVAREIDDDVLVRQDEEEDA